MSAPDVVLDELRPEVKRLEAGRPEVAARAVRGGLSEGERQAALRDYLRVRWGGEAERLHGPPNPPEL